MHILILSDGRNGHLNQSIALALHLNATYDIVDVRWRYSWAKAISFILDFLNIHVSFLYSTDALLNKKYDFIVSAGSNTYYALISIGKKLDTKTIAMMFPRGYKQKKFSYIFAQDHDNPPTKQNIIKLPINMSYVIPKELYIPKKSSVGIVIGGNNSVFRMDCNYIVDTILWIKNNFKDHEIVISTSPRTPQELEDMIEKISFDYCVLYSKNKINPIPDFLKYCEYIFLTSDSTSMISEAVSYGNSNVEVIPLKSIKKNKFDTFASNLAKENYLHIWNKNISKCSKKINLQEFAKKVLL